MKSSRRRSNKKKQVLRKRNTKRRGRSCRRRHQFAGAVSKETTTIKHLDRDTVAHEGILSFLTNKERSNLAKSGIMHEEIFRDVILSFEESERFARDANFAKTFDSVHTTRKDNICLQFDGIDFTAEGAIQMEDFQKCKQITFTHCTFPPNNNPVHPSKHGGVYQGDLSYKENLLSRNFIKNVGTVIMRQCTLADCYFLRSIEIEVLLDDCDIMTDGITWLTEVPVVRLINSRLTDYYHYIKFNLHDKKRYTSKTKYLEHTFTQIIPNNDITHFQGAYFQIFKHNLETLVLNNIPQFETYPEDLYWAATAESLRVLRVINCNFPKHVLMNLRKKRPKLVIITE